jgi:hypothetical protein
MNYRNLLILSVALTACGKKAESPRTPDPARPQASKSLTEMSVTEALRTKYESAVLRCSVTTTLSRPGERGSQVRTAATTSDSAQIDLLEEGLTFPREIYLQAGTSTKHYLQATITLKKLEMAQEHLLQPDGTHYRLVNSPQIDANAVILTEVWPDASGPVRSCGEAPITIREQVESVFEDGTTASPKPSDTQSVNKGGCVIETKAKPGYESEFAREN